MLREKNRYFIFFDEFFFENKGKFIEIEVAVVLYSWVSFFVNIFLMEIWCGKDKSVGFSNF